MIKGFFLKINSKTSDFKIYMSDSLWDKSIEASGKKEFFEGKTIMISQPSSKSKDILSNDEPLTDEYLNSILPIAGFKIIPPPSNYAPKKNIDVSLKEDRQGKDMMSIPAEFMLLYTDPRPDGELDPNEKKERFAMQLLLQIKNGTVYERKKGMRILITHAPKFGAKLIFSKLLPLLKSNVLSDLERHTFVKAVDRLMYRLSGAISEYIPDLLSFAGKMLIDSDVIIRAEAKEIIGNLSKICGLPIMMKNIKGALDNPDKSIRSIACQTIAIAATSNNVENVISFIRAMIKSKISWRIRHSAVMIIRSIALQMKNGILPFLPKFVDILCTSFVDNDENVISSSIKCVKALAEASTPFGSKTFSPITSIVFEGLNGSFRRLCLESIGALFLTMDQQDAAFHFRDITRHLLRSFQSQDSKEKMVSILVFERALNQKAVDAQQIGFLSNDFFDGFWNNRTSLERSISRPLASVTSKMASLSSVNEILNRIFDDFKNKTPDYRRIVVDTFERILASNNTIIIHMDTLRKINDCLVFGFDSLKDDEKSIKLYMSAMKPFIAYCGERIDPFLDSITSHIHHRINVASNYSRQQAALLICLYSESFILCNRKPALVHLYKIIQEMFEEEYASVLSAVLEAVRSIVLVLSIEDLDPGPDEVVARLVPILKNRNDQVAASCVGLITVLSQKSSSMVNKKEWIRICLELLELFKAEKKKVRQSSINAFAYIAKAIGPFDVLLSLLNNLKVQERQIRVCTSIAIAVLAENCGTYNVLPALMNEYRIPDSNVQTGTLKTLQHLFQIIGRDCSNYCYAITPLLTNALIERDPVHRQLACSVVKYFVLGCFASGEEDAVLHLFNHLLPNIFETTLHFIDSLMDAIDSMRVTLGPGIVYQYIINGLFHPAKKVRSQFWRVYNNLIIYSGDQLVPFYPQMQNSKRNEYHLSDLDLFI